MRTRTRPLTEGEIALASLLFRDAIDYQRVRIHGRRYMPCQPKNCCMTPNGSMYFHHSCFLDDYSQANLTGQHWFLHEMVNLWQGTHLYRHPARAFAFAAVRCKDGRGNQSAEG